LKKRSLVFCALAAVVTAGVLAGCGNNYYFAGRVLPPSGILNRVLIAIQNPSTSTKGGLQFVDAYYDIRQSYNDKTPYFTISGYSGALPVTIQNMPEEQKGAVYASGDGTFSLIDYQKESAPGAAATFNGLSSSAFLSRDQYLAVAASQQAHILTVVDKAYGKSYGLSLPGIYRVSMNPGGTVVLAFVQNANNAYYPRRLQDSETTALAAYYGQNQSWPAPYVDCEPKNLPGMCLAEVESPDHYNSTINAYYGTPLTFDRPVKALWSADGSSAYILSCGPECGGTASSVAILPVAPIIIQSGQQAGSLPKQSAMVTIPVPGGASNALVDSGTLYVMGQEKMPDGYFGGHLTAINLATNKAGNPIAVSDSSPGQPTKMILADDSTLWLGGVRCTEGERYNNNEAYGCLTMVDSATNTVTLIEPFQGDLNGIAAVTGLHKIYIAEGGQIYIYSTKDGSAINNFYVTVQGTAHDVAYMDAITDTDNTDY
jgi:hypothetical protein